MQTIASPHPDQRHKSLRSNWLRAAVLGINDGIVSTSSLMLGVSAATVTHSVILTAGIAGLTAGAISMAIGEYVSVSSKRDSELADIELERSSIEKNPEQELTELAAIYEERGLDPDLARRVATALHEHDATLAHARDELGIDANRLARPFQAAGASALSFAIGAIIPIIAALSSMNDVSLAIISISLVALAASGFVSASIGGGNRLASTLRVFFGGAFAMAVTMWIGHLVGTYL